MPDQVGHDLDADEYKENFMICNKILITTTLLLTPLLACAALSAHGPYLGVQGGYVNPHDSHAEKVWNGLRPFLGYRFNDNFALEAGYDSLNRKSDSKMYGVDLLGKAIVPFPHNFSFFIEAGAAYIQQDIKNYRKKNNILPAAGIGVGFNFTQHFAADLSWLHMTDAFGKIHSIDFAAIGLSFTV
jgi:opacity protein-like surface antigen